MAPCGSPSAPGASTTSARPWPAEAVDRTIEPFRDPEFSREQADKINALIATRTKELPPRDFVEMMRAAIKEDEWMLYAHGAIMGFAGGLLHLALFGSGRSAMSEDGRLVAVPGTAVRTTPEIWTRGDRGAARARPDRRPRRRRARRRGRWARACARAGCSCAR